MSQRTSIQLTMIVLVVLVTVSKAQTYQPNGEVDVVRVADKIYMLRINSRTGNPNIAAIIGPDGVLLVDSGFASFSDKVKAKLKELGGANVRIVINTHWHGDHTGGNEAFGPEAAILARSNTRLRLTKQGLLEDNGRLLATRGLPVVTFDSNLTLFFNQEEIRISAPPAGHTDGDAVVYFAKAKVLCVGDYLFVGKFPVIDIEESGASLDGYLKNLKMLIDTFPADAQIVPGHSLFWPGSLNVMTMNDLKAYHDSLLESITFIRGRIKAGKTLAEIQEEGLPEKFKTYDERPRFVSAVKWIETVFNSESLGQNPERWYPRFHTSFRQIAK